MANEEVVELVEETRRGSLVFSFFEMAQTKF
jgi:hypothetical protein